MLRRSCRTDLCSRPSGPGVHCDRQLRSSMLKNLIVAAETSRCPKETVAANNDALHPLEMAELPGMTLRSRKAQKPAVSEVQQQVLL
ncbi:hypothetical protein K470DRAFT_258627 [Piedraia hortae CBS 480.64]|uniref:Uncharacterized protein n=1 Tax=Piedraia hortae CBS 480.64 TaxID=1314780 RepID=A0A6A7BXI1_9PEZI|nr:hypothetical protein K470DRAFT_258627 [Piedraia hortae CBS 480.64]